jgi:dynein light intermediate chain
MSVEYTQQLQNTSTIKNKTDKLERIRQEIIENSKNNNEREKNITLISSLVKYDTPFLVSSSITNKKTLEDLELNEESANIYLREIINKGSSIEGTFEREIRDYSVKDALNKILPPKKITENEKIWVQYVSSTPVTKAEVVTLQEGLDRKLQTQQARETGICPIREKLYHECFDELIRQVTLNCLERGILLMRIKKEIEMTINSYQTLYESSIAYGIRTLLIAEEDKKNLSIKIEEISDECDMLEKEIEALENEINNKKEYDKVEREEAKRKHEEQITEERKIANEKKEKLKSLLLNFDNK